MSDESYHQANKDQLDAISQIAQAAIARTLDELFIPPDGAEHLARSGVRLVHTLSESIREILIAEMNVGKFELRYPNYRKLSTGGNITKGSSFEAVLKDLKRQAAILRQLFNIDVSYSKEWAELAWNNFPAGAAKLFLVPESTMLGPSYGQALSLVLEKLQETRKESFTNQRNSNLDLRYIRQQAKTLDKLREISKEQAGNGTLVLASQVGERQTGLTALEARESLFTTEFGLGAYACGIMLLTNPYLLRSGGLTYLDCIGDECSALGNGDFSHYPFFYADEYTSGFTICEKTTVHENSGTVSAFTPHDTFKLKKI